MADLAGDDTRAPAPAHPQTDALPTREAIVDALVAEATYGRFLGDHRDGEAPPATLENALTEAPRYFARAHRARLMRLSYPELCVELVASGLHVIKAAEDLKNRLARFTHDEQSARGSSPRRQRQAIEAAVRHHQAGTADKTWGEIARAGPPFKTEDGAVVTIEGPRSAQHMRVTWPDGHQGHPIIVTTFRKNYYSRKLVAP
jgi:hypothetical protein